MEIYIHVPFCKKKCLYCDFNSYADCENKLIFGYLTALNREIELAGKQVGKGEKNHKITSVFIGGGTPNLLKSEHVENLLEKLKNHFDFNDDAEITIEANPESLTEQKIIAYKRAGINRLSMGVQSLYDDNLQAIGRIHDVQTAKRAIELARKHFDNLSCDLMIGLPFDDAERVESEVKALANVVDHLSVYQLILEEGTPLEKLVKEGIINLPSDDEVADLMNVAVETLKNCGFGRYEVSNFAKNGKISRHNLGYWTREEYIGLGAGAASYLKQNGEIRFSNCKSVQEYVENVESASDYFAIPRAEFDELDERAIKDEKIMLGLRTNLGVKKALIPDFALTKYRKYFEIAGDRVCLNDEGFAIMNAILVDIMDFSD